MRIAAVLVIAASALAAVPAAALADTPPPACQYDGTYYTNKITMFRVPGQGVSPTAAYTVTTPFRKIHGHLVNGRATVQVHSANVTRVTVAGRLCETT